MTEIFPYRRLWLLLVCIFAAPAPSAEGAEKRWDKAEQAVERIAVLLEKFQADPERRVPAGILEEARGIAIIHETRAGLILGGKGGSGVLLVKNQSAWRAPALYRTHEGGIGLQAGWQQATFIQVLMSDAAVQSIRTNQFRFGVGLRVTSGPRSMGDEAKARASGADVLVYADTGGLYGGFALEGGSLRPDARANQDLYGMAAEDVLFGKGAASTPAGRKLIQLLGAAEPETGSDR